MRDSVIFYRSFYEAINELPKEIQADVYSAIFEYSLNGEELVLTGLPKTIFTLIKPQLEANNKRFENGKHGGRPKKQPEQEQEQIENKPNDNQIETKHEANNNVNVNNNDNLNVKESVPPAPAPVYSDEEKLGFKNFEEWIIKNAPRVQKMKEPFTIAQYVRLKEKGFERDAIRQLLVDMHNWMDLTKKRVSAYLTLTNWHNREPPKK